MSERAKMPKQWVPNICECGGGAYLSHYDLMRCACGKWFWALRPKKNGPLVMFPWPGDYHHQHRDLAA
jgi:hypothetical protein